MLILGRFDGAVSTSSRRSPSRTLESVESRRSLWKEKERKREREGEREREIEKERENKRERWRMQVKYL